MKKSGLAILMSALLFTLGCSDSDGNNNNGGTTEPPTQPPVNPPTKPPITPPPVVIEGKVTVEFPGLKATTTRSKLTIRGSADKNTSDIKVNGITAKVSEGEPSNKWIAEVPLEPGANNPVLSYTTEGKNKSQALPTIHRNSDFIQLPVHMSRAALTGDTYVYDSTTTSILKIDKDKNVSFVYQFMIADDEQSHDKLHKSTPLVVWVNADASFLYYPAYFNNQFYMLRLDLNTKEISELYGPDSPEYQRLNVSKEFPILHRENENELILANENPVDSIFGFDLDTNTVIDYNVEYLNGPVLTANFWYLSLAKKNDNALHFLAAGSNNSNLVGELSLTNGSIYKKDIIPNNSAKCNSFNSMDRFAFHNASRHFLIAKGDTIPGDDLICGINTAVKVIDSVNSQLNEFPSPEIKTGYMNVIGSDLYFGGSNKNSYRLNQYDLNSVFPIGSVRPAKRNQIGDSIVAGDATIQPRTAREVLYNNKTDKLYWIIQHSKSGASGQIQVLDIATDEWSHLGDYSYTGFKGAELNQKTNSIYIVNDDLSSDSELIRVDLETGQEEVVIGSAEKATLPHSDFNLIASALNLEEQVIYLARIVSSSSLNSGEYPFSLVAYDIQSGELNEIVPVGNKQISVGYDMDYDPKSRQVLFYDDRSGQDYVIHAINVDSGEVTILSQESVISGPDIFNSRDHVTDSQNNRLLSSSQDHQSVYAVDLSSGKRELVSAGSPMSGPVFIRPVGVDLIGNKNIASTADEDINGIYWVDLKTGERVIIQH